MRLLICDSFRISTFVLPTKVEDYFTINYYYSSGSFSTIETLNLEAKNGVWNLLTNESLIIKLGDVFLKEVVLKEYSIYKINFSDIKENIYIYVLGDSVNYYNYSTLESQKIVIGNSANATICCADKVSLEEQLVIYRDGNSNFNVVNNDNPNLYVYLNGYTFKEKKLEIGDVIFLNGLKIIWMGNFIKVNQIGTQARFVKLTTFNDSVNNEYTKVSDLERNVKLFKENDIFFHTPILRSDIKEYTVNIELPPPPYNEQGMPMILTIGSSVMFGLVSCVTGISAVQGLIQGNMDKTSAIIELVICFLMIVSSIIFPIITDVWERNRQKKMEKLRQERYKSYLDKNIEMIKGYVIEQEKILKENNLDMNTIANDIKNHSKRLWSRNLFDNDFLSITFGVGEFPAAISVKVPTEGFSMTDDNLKELAFSKFAKKPMLSNVPVNLSVIDNRILPILMNTKLKDDFIKSIMLQILYYHSGKDLKIVILTNKNNEERWDYLKYMPHCWDDKFTKRFFAVSESEMTDVSIFLESVYEKRESSSNSKADNGADKGYLDFPEYYLIVTDDFKTAKDTSIVKKLMDSDNNLGFSLLIFANSINNMPSKFNNFIDINDEECCVYGRKLEKSEQVKFKMNCLSNINMSDYIDVLANIPLYSKDISVAIPNNLTFLNMYNVGKIDQLNVLSRWKNNDPTFSLKAPIGEKEKNKIIELDLHEKYHGPHGLIAGSTGSGKSEFIITYILSMAVNYHPYEVQFILIDYKGGGLALAFENRETGVKIPHLVGTITNLDTSEMNRTLVSLKSELKRRQRIFNETRNKLGESTVDIYKYQRFYREGKVDEPMSHLFVISDEFAELKDQQPDFMDELISTARIGRSLGVHLILATQKPSGVVNDQIWSNTRFRVCLRVQSDEDSVEMLKRNDAATLKNTGRFYLQVGSDEIFELGQSGWAGALYNPSDKIEKKVNDDLDFVDNCGNIIKSVNDAVNKEINNQGEQLTNIVKYLYDIANKEQINFSSLWLPSLPDEIYLGNLIKKYNFKPNYEKFSVILGEFDQPASQFQGLYTLDLISSNTVIFGLPGCGKENLITTIIFSACIGYSPTAISFYIMDFGAQVLKCFDSMPHVGDCLFSEHMDKISTLFSKIEREIKKRKTLFSDYDGTFSSYVKESGKRIPLMVIVLNAYESFIENCDVEYESYLAHLLREGSKYGIVFLVSAVATNSIRGSMMDCFENKIMMQVQDPFDYEFLIGAEHGMQPRKAFGRGISLIPAVSEVCEFQTCFINKKDDITSYVKKVGVELYNKYKYKVPEIKNLPKKVTYKDMYKYLNGIDAIPIGYTRDDILVYYYNFIKHRCNFILGNSVTDNITFFGGIIDLIDNFAKINFTIIDFINCIDFEGNAMMYQSNFNEAFDDIVNDANIGIVNLYFIIGLGNYANVLSEAEITKFDNIMLQMDKFNNSYFIFVDDISRISNVESKAWFSNFDFSFGIWSGKGIEEQTIFSIDNLLDDDVDSDMNDIAYVIESGSYQVLKVIGDGEVVENDNDTLGGFFNG